MLGRSDASRDRRTSAGTLASHQPRPARDAADAMERGGVARRACRVQAGARAAERDLARGVVQLRRVIEGWARGCSPSHRAVGRRPRPD